MKTLSLVSTCVVILCCVFPKLVADETRFQDGEWTVFADLLIWTAREAGADNWAEKIDTVGIILPNRANRLQEVSFPWDIGFGIGASYAPKCTCWDTKAYYTRFYTQGTDNLFGGPGTIHSTFLGNFYVNNPDGSGISGPAYERASINWTIDFNIFDWDIGCTICTSNWVNFRPFLGLKGGWIHQSIHSTWENPNIVGVGAFQIGTENLKNNFWGIGPQAGIESKWNLFAGPCDLIHLFGDFSGAMLYGHWSFADIYQNDLPEHVIIGNPSMNSGASMLRAFMGLEWVATSPCRLSAKLGFEMQFWLDQLRYYSFTGGRLGNQLTLQGGTLEFCFSF